MSYQSNYHHDKDAICVGLEALHVHFYTRHVADICTYALPRKICGLGRLCLLAVLAFCPSLASKYLTYCVEWWEQLCRLFGMPTWPHPRPHTVTTTRAGRCGSGAHGKCPGICPCTGYGSLRNGAALRGLAQQLPPSLHPSLYPYT